MKEHGARRTELAKFLRSRRQRITPADVGLPVGPRRRTKGLRREEVAVLAGLSPTWYTYLEQGRNIRPSAAVLDSLVRVLQLSNQERQYMYLLAHGQAPQTGTDPPEDGIAHDLVRFLVNATNEWDHPVYAFDSVGTILTWNRSCTIFYADFAKLPAEHRNIIRWMFTSPHARERFVEWEHDAKEMIAHYRIHHATQLLNTERRRLISELEECSPEFRRWWHDHDVHAQHTRTRQLRHPDLGLIRFQLAVLRPADDPSLSVTFHFPNPLPNTP
ncbi:MAG: helix-turn-helix transcriptional regulator [Pseudonocardiaceae bacterium]